MSSPAFCRLPVSGAVALLAAGCAVGPDYHRPQTQVPSAYRFAAESGPDSFADRGWWEIYQDPALADLIRQAIQNNYDTRIAVTRVEQARAIAAQTHSSLFPNVGYGAGISTGRNEASGSPSYNFGDNNTPVFGGLTASWELDIWGRIRRLNEAAVAQYLASQEAQRAVLLSVVSDVAQAYFELLELDLELAIARRTTESFGESLRIFTLRLQHGTASNLETSRAEAAMTSVAASIPDLERLIQLKENQISLLCGRAPTPIARRMDLTDAILAEEVPVGLPASLIEHRPDVRQAEDDLRTAKADRRGRRGVLPAHQSHRIPGCGQP